MEMFKNNKKMTYLVVALLLVIVIGLIIVVTIGLQYSLAYSRNSRLYMHIPTEFNIEDIRPIVNDVFENQATHVQTRSLEPSILIITARRISEEQENEIVRRINEKYEVETTSGEETFITTNGNVRGRNIVRPYIGHVTIAVLAILSYALIRYKGIGTLEVTGIVLGMLVFSQALYLSILAITRIPISRLTMPISLTLFVVVSVICLIKLEQMHSSMEAPKE